MAIGAEVGGAPAENNSRNRGFAAETRFVFTSIHAMKELEAAFFAVSIDVVAQGAAAMVDGAAENEFY